MGCAKSAMTQQSVEPSNPVNHGIHKRGKSDRLEISIVITGSEIPQNVVRDLFVVCDLPTRCKLRRVCHYWKWLVSSHQVNQVVLVNWRCTHVSNPQYECKGTARVNPCPGSAFHKETDKLQFGWYDVGMPEAFLTEKEYSEYLRRSGPCDTLTTNVCLADHRRQGLLGSHVKTIIYDYQDQDDSAVCRKLLGQKRVHIVRAIRSIGYYCCNVQHIVLWHYGLRRSPYGRGSMRRDDFWHEPPSGLPTPSAFTVIASEFCDGIIMVDPMRVNNDVMYGYVYELQVKITAWTDTTIRDDLLSFVRHFMPSKKDFRIWLSQNARYLPEKYHEWARKGIDVGGGNRFNVTIKMDLKDGDYMNLCPYSDVSKQDLKQEHLPYEYFLGTLAKWILEENVGITDIPPNSPACCIVLI